MKLPGGGDAVGMLGETATPGCGDGFEASGSSDCPSPGDSGMAPGWEGSRAPRDGLTGNPGSNDGLVAGGRCELVMIDSSGDGYVKGC